MTHKSSRCPMYFTIWNDCRADFWEFQLLLTMLSRCFMCYMKWLKGWLLRILWSSEMTHKSSRYPMYCTTWNDFWEFLSAANDVILLVYVLYEKTVGLTFENFVESSVFRLPTMYCTIWHDCKTDFWEFLPAANDVISLLNVPYEITVKLAFENFYLLPLRRPTRQHHRKPPNVEIL